MDNTTAPEGISEVEEEKVPSASTASEQREEGVLTEHDGDKAREIEAAFTKTEEWTDEVRQEARDEGAKLARETQETSKPQQQHIQEVPKPIAPIENHTEGLGPQTQPEQQIPPQTGSKLAIAGTVFQQERAILREKMRAENGEVKKAA